MKFIREKKKYLLVVDESQYTFCGIVRLSLIYFWFGRLLLDIHDENIHIADDENIGIHGNTGTSIL